MAYFKWLMTQTRFLKGFNVSNVWRRFERLIFSAKGNRKRGAMLIMKMLSQKDFQFVYYFSLFCLIACLFFIPINRINIFLKSTTSLIPADTRLFSPKRTKNVFGKWNSHQYRKNQGKLSVSVIIKSLEETFAKKLSCLQALDQGHFCRSEINRSNKENKETCGLFEVSASFSYFLNMLPPNLLFFHRPVLLFYKSSIKLKWVFKEFLLSVIIRW